MTLFFGREQEQTQLAALLTTHRLVTITGPGGNGKTRLTVETASSLMTPFTGGVRFLYLGDLLDVNQLPDALRQTLHLPARPGTAPLDQVIAALATAPSLLILDNFEHLAEAGASLVRTLLDLIPLLTLAVTSRRVLGLPGEREFPLAPLPVPRDGMAAEDLSAFASVRLFLDRAQAVRPDFQLTPRNANAMAALCRYLEGIPLALELAAARIRTLTLAQMTARLMPRLELLVNPRADKDARHRSLRTTIAWSVQMLSPDARRFFARLAVFQGGWDAEAAGQVCLALETADDPENLDPLRWNALDLLERLLSESLVIAEEQEGAMRFRMLETLREFAWEQLPPQEQEHLHYRHACYWMQFAAEIAPRLNGPQRKEMLDRLEEERANLTAALAWCVESPGNAVSPSPTEIGLRMMGALGRFWETRGSAVEGRRFTELLLEQAHTGIATTALARAHLTASILANATSDFAPALAHSEQALAEWRRVGDREGVCDALLRQGLVLSYQGRMAEAQRCYEEGLALARDLAISWRIAAFLNNLGALQRILGDFDTAQENLQEALLLRQQLGDLSALYSTLNSLAALAHNRRDFPAAVRGHEEALAIARELKDRPSIAISLINLGFTHLLLKDYSAAHPCFAEALQLHLAVGNRLGQAYAIGGLSAHAAALDVPERAGALLGASDALLQALQAHHATLEQQLADPAFAPLAADPRFLNALETGANLPLHAAISLALQPLF